MALTISDTKVRLREIILRDKPGEMIAASQKATVPVLKTNDTVIDESLAIMHWALARHDPEGWLVPDSAALIEEADGPFKHHLDRYKYSTRYDDADKLEHRDGGMAFLMKLDARLGDTSFLFGEERTLADIAIFPFVRQFRIADPDWFDAAPLPKIQGWLSGLMNSELFLSVMKKYPTWKESGEEFEFPNSTTTIF